MNRIKPPFSFGSTRLSPLTSSSFELSEAFFSPVICGIEDTAEKYNYNVLIAQSHDYEQRERQILLTMKNHPVDGWIFSIMKNTVNHDHFLLLKEDKIAVIFSTASEFAQHSFCWLRPGARHDASSLLPLGKGHRKIGQINGSENLVASLERLAH